MYYKGLNPIQCKSSLQRLKMSMGIHSTCSMISVPDPLNKYGTRLRPHTDVDISIRVINGYLDTYGYIV